MPSVLNRPACQYDAHRNYFRTLTIYSYLWAAPHLTTSTKHEVHRVLKATGASTSQAHCWREHLACTNTETTPRFKELRTHENKKQKRPVQLPATHGSRSRSSSSSSNSTLKLQPHLHVHGREWRSRRARQAPAHRRRSPRNGAREAAGRAKIRHRRRGKRPGWRTHCVSIITVTTITIARRLWV